MVTSSMAYLMHRHNRRDARRSDSFTESSLDQPMESLILDVQYRTWKTDTHGLFDYEARTSASKTFKYQCTTQSLHVLRMENDIFMLQQPELDIFQQSFPSAQHLVQLRWIHGRLCLLPESPWSRSTPCETPWLVIRGFKADGVALEEDDVIRLGRCSFRVKEAVHSTEEQEFKSLRKHIAQSDCQRRPQPNDTDDCETIAPPDSVEIAHITQENITMEENEHSHHYIKGLECHSCLSLEGRPCQFKNPVCESNASSVAEEGAVKGKEHCIVNVKQREGPTLTTSSHIGRRVSRVDDPEENVQKRKRFDRTTRFCRICLGEENDDMLISLTDPHPAHAQQPKRNNPLIAPCHCKGSMKWVHLMCLRTWVAGRLNIHDDKNNIYVFWRSLECELCRLPYPSVVEIPSNEILESTPYSRYFQSKKHTYADSEKRRYDDQVAGDEYKQNESCDNSRSVLSENYNGLSLTDSPVFYSPTNSTRHIELFEVPRPSVPYAILESFGTDKPGLHIVSLATTQSIRMGRGNNSDVRLFDISVSRIHSTLNFKTPTKKKKMVIGNQGPVPLVSGRFVIADYRSKFGTLLAIQKPFPLDLSGVSTMVQVGRTLLTFRLTRRWTRFIPRCFGSSKWDISLVLRNPVKVIPHHRLPLTKLHRGNSLVALPQCEENEYRFSVPSQESSDESLSSSSFTFRQHDLCRSTCSTRSIQRRCFWPLRNRRGA